MATINGGAGNDTLLGGFDHDAINGFGGNDRLSGVDGNDTLNGGAGNDKLAGGVENDVLLGDAGNDTLDGGLDDDTLKGGAGNDLYIVSSLFDVVEEVPGGGKDTIRATFTYQLSDGQEIENLILDSSGLITGIGNVQDNLITMVGTGRGIMYGWVGNDTLKGGIGDDDLRGGTGDDILAGGKGHDAYHIDSVADKISELAGQGRDLVVSSLKDYTLGANLEDLFVNNLNGTGNTLKNLIMAGGFANILSGMGGNDTLYGGNANDTLLGGAGDDALYGELGDDSMNGGAGNDHYLVWDAGDIVTEAKGGGTDTIETGLDNLTLFANVENLLLVAGLNAAGNELANKMTGNAGQNMLEGHAGNDTLDGGGGNDTLKGGTGNDLYLVDSFDDVVEDSGGGKDTIRATSTYRLFDSQEIESFILDSDGEIGGTGNSQGNRITMVGAGQALMQGFAGNDTLTGGVGDDALLGDVGDDVMAGGKGNDFYVVDSIGDKITESAGQGIDRVNSFLNDYTLGANLEELLVNGFSGTGNALDNYLDSSGLSNKLRGLAGNDLIFGRNGDDTIDGGTGDDLLVGGAGDDSMTGGAGDDWYDAVDDAGDVVVELAGGGIDTVETNSNGHVLAANVENLALVGAAAISGAGNGLANALFGSFAGNWLSGLAGNDTLDGAGGDDTLIGGAGDDLYLIDSFNDVVEDGVGGGKDTIRATTTYQLSEGQEIESFILDSVGDIGGFGNAQGNLITMVGTGAAFVLGKDGNDTLTGGVGNDEFLGGNDNDLLSGRGGNDTLVGEDGADTLKGGIGNDKLEGGLGADVLFGEAGADVFVYSVLSAPDLSMLGNDKINGFQKGVDKINLVDLITDFGVDADNAFTGKFVVLGKSGANSVIQFDQDGSAGGLAPVTLATVTGVSLKAADFILETS